MKRGRRGIHLRVFCLTKSHNFEDFSGRANARTNLARNAVRGFSFLLFSGGGDFVIRLGSTAILARLISPDHFGLFMMVTAVTALADQFRDFGLSTATIQRDHITHEEVSNLFWINASAGILLALITCGLSPLVVLYFREPRLAWMTVTVALTIVFGGLTVQHEALLGRQMRVGGRAANRLLASFLSSVIAIVLAMEGFGYWALVWREVCRSAFVAIGVWAICPWVPGRPRRDTDVRSHLRFGSGLTASYMLGELMAGLDRILLGRFQGASAVGVYRQSYQLVVTPMNQLMGPLYQVALPGLSMLQAEPKRYRSFFLRIVAIVAAVSMPLSVFIAIYAEYISAVILGDQWQGAATFIRIFGIGGMLQSVFSTIGFVLVSRGRSGELLKLAVTQAVVKTVLMLIGLRWGPVGVALGDMSTIAVMTVPYLYISFKDSSVTIDAFRHTLIRPFSASLLLALILVSFHGTVTLPNALAHLAAGAALTTICFPLFWVMLPGGRLELRELRLALRVALERAN